jgi:hypothetical protein
VANYTQKFPDALADLLIQATEYPQTDPSRESLV